MKEVRLMEIRLFFKVLIFSILWLTQGTNIVSANYPELQTQLIVSHKNSTSSEVANAFSAEEHRRQKRLVISGTIASIAWSVFFTPLATMTVTKNFDAFDWAKRCVSRGKAHYENEHPLDAFWKSIFCKQTEAEGKGKKVLVDIVATAFIYMTPEAGRLLEQEFAVFQEKMNKLRADKNQIEHLDWNTPGSKGKMFLCFLQKNLFQEQPSAEGHSNLWKHQFVNDAAADKFWHECQRNIEKRHEMSWQAKAERRIALWIEKPRGTLDCIRHKIASSFVNFGEWLKKSPGPVQQMQEEKEQHHFMHECYKKEEHKSLIAEVRERTENWPAAYDIFDSGISPEIMRNAADFVDLFRKYLLISREVPVAPFSKFMKVTSDGIAVNWQLASISFYYPKIIRLITDRTLEEAQLTLQYFDLTSISDEQKKHLAMLEVRAVMARFFVEMAKEEEENGPATDGKGRKHHLVVEDIFFPKESGKETKIKERRNFFNSFFDNFGKFLAMKMDPISIGMFRKENAVERDLLVAGNDMHMEAFQEIFRIQDENVELYQEIMLDALTNVDEKKADQQQGQAVEQEQEDGHRAKRSLGAISTLLYGMGMQQGYRHFNLIQLIRDCTVRSLNYKTFRCYPPPIIQEEIQFIQKAKDIVFQELSWAAVMKIGQKLGSHARENLRRKNALVEMRMSLLERNLDLADYNLRDGQLPVPVPIAGLKKLLQNRNRNHVMVDIPSEQLRETMVDCNRMPYGGMSWRNLAANIQLSRVVKIPLENYLNWSKDANFPPDLVIPEKELAFWGRHGGHLPVRGQLIQYRINAIAASGKDVERLSGVERIPNPAETVAPILKPGQYTEIALSYFTDNPTLDGLDLLHIPMRKLKEMFGGKEKVDKKVANRKKRYDLRAMGFEKAKSVPFEKNAVEDVKIPIPVNFLAERYKPASSSTSTVTVPYPFIREWANPETNVHVRLDDEFLTLLEASSLKAVPVPSLWLLSTAFNATDSIQVAQEQFLRDYDKMVNHGGRPEHFPLLKELNQILAMEPNRIHKKDAKEKAVNARNEVHFYKPTYEPAMELKFGRKLLENVDYADVDVSMIKRYMDEKLRMYDIPRVPRNIWVTVQWLKEQRAKRMAEESADLPKPVDAKGHPPGAAGPKPQQSFIVPIIRRFLDDFVFKVDSKEQKEKGKKKAKGNANDQKEPKVGEEEYPGKLTVTLTFLAEVMKSSQKIQTPSKMLTDAGLEMPWKYARYLDCHAEYQFIDEETRSRCEIYQRVEQNRNEEEKREKEKKKQQETANAYDGDAVAAEAIIHGYDDSVIHDEDAGADPNSDGTTDQREKFA